MRQLRKPAVRAVLASLAATVLLLAGAPTPAHAGRLGDIVEEVNKDGRREKFQVRSDGSIWHTWQITNGGYYWDTGQLDGHANSGIGVIHNKDGRIEIFVRADGGDLVHRSQKEINGWTGWSDWVSLGGSLMPGTAIWADRTSNNLLTVRVTGTDGYDHRKTQTGENCCWPGVWS